MRCRSAAPLRGSSSRLLFAAPLRSSYLLLLFVTPFPSDRSALKEFHQPRKKEKPNIFPERGAGSSLAAALAAAPSDWLPRRRSVTRCRPSCDPEKLQRGDKRPRPAHRPAPRYYHNPPSYQLRQHAAAPWERRPSVLGLLLLTQQTPASFPRAGVNAVVYAVITRRRALRIWGLLTAGGPRVGTLSFYVESIQSSSVNRFWAQTGDRRQSPVASSLTLLCSTRVHVVTHGHASAVKNAAVLLFVAACWTLTKSKPTSCDYALRRATRSVEQHQGLGSGGLSLGDQKETSGLLREAKCSRPALKVWWLELLFKALYEGAAKFRPSRGDQDRVQDWVQERVQDRVQERVQDWVQDRVQDWVQDWV
ncbi:hypothetical protein EYF80_001572 [Liparis tanakae]|uniref:Uncharacterized protein n=1 Tax=Liparis tanakae TaxID=230148 RepID=A0A4Z2JDN6_9TELE|nr:hypothetical protein EYF80_001572 [Liparis tanakae]